MKRILLLFALMVHSSLAKNQLQQSQPQAPTKQWQTLSGEPPLVIARGGFSGLFPESSIYANDIVNQLNHTKMALSCNLQLTKDGIGICLSDIRLDNSTNIRTVFPNDSNTYNVNGHQVQGWFAVDFTSDVMLKNVTLVQSIPTRTNVFDDRLPVSTVEDVAGVKPPVFWLNVQYDVFYTEHNLSVSMYLEKERRFMGINFISSPEIGFLIRMNGKVNKAETKLVFVFLDPEVIEPTTKQKYREILNDLSAIKLFVSGILVPKEYIWPVDANKYLANPTTLVADAHKLGLQVYASGFANDMPASYNYSYDPTNEYLQFIDNPDFSVDGLLTDFSPTASTAIACFARDETTILKKGKALIISHNGASGMFPGCTDLAYEQAANDGADIIDCSVQMSKDGVAFCLDSADLTRVTTAMPAFMSRSSSVPEVQKNRGIFSFDLTWSEIQTLKPQMESPFDQTDGFQRNPEAKNKGKFMTLVEFLDFARENAISGILINIENAAYLASKKGLDIVGSITKALSDATFDEQRTQQVLIQSDDSSVLSKFQGVPAYKRLLHIAKPIGDAPERTVNEIKKFADGVVVPKSSLISLENGFTKAQTKVLEEMRAAKISVYVYVLRNEFVALPFDYFADPTRELATYVAALEVDGVITEFPATASRYMRSPCVVLPAEPGALLKQASSGALVLPPANPPNPPLQVADVVDPPLPAVTDISSSTASSGSSRVPATSLSGMAITANFGLCLAVIMASNFLSSYHSSC
ncbi:Glycerophosphodiester phosphodiesterase (GDPD) like 7, SHV3-like 5 [Hibiscus trionum]|uniref:glycerophosphodiester phosphodiesterase n=1 Tax=Hibiscus trionum TaxID=183268 RepID=A0A9W7I666_HIBTR|nr:Glycerophosphodiester phosphodiesterase (GDPD) like 7, SHV3-like 5 [Hibiscus trionum]